MYFGRFIHATYANDSLRHVKKKDITRRRICCLLGLSRLGSYRLWENTNFSQNMNERNIRRYVD